MSSYGFAILIIVIAIIIIYRIGLSGVNGFTQQTCTAQPGFSCDYVSLNTTGILAIKMSQNVATNMKINAIACSAALNNTSAGPQFGNVNMVPSNSFYPAGSSPVGMTFYGSSESIFYMNCYGSGGILTGQISKPVIVYVFINYTAPGYQPVTQLIITDDGAYT